MGREPAVGCRGVCLRLVTMPVARSLTAGGGGLLYQQKGPPFGDPALGDSPLESTIVEFIYSGLLFSKGDIFREMLQPVFRKAADIHH
jgi:hypothetical protein